MTTSPRRSRAFKPCGAKWWVFNPSLNDLWEYRGQRSAIPYKVLSRVDLLRTQRGGKKETKTVLPFSNGTVVIPVCMFSNNIPPPMPWQVGLHYSFHAQAAPAVEALYSHPPAWRRTHPWAATRQNETSRARLKAWSCPGMIHGIFLIPWPSFGPYQ